MSYLIETPSWLTSWVAWRNFYTKPGDVPFTDLMEELGIGSFMGLSLAYNTKYKVCPHCDDQYVVLDDKWGLIYCVCQVLEFQEKQYNKFDGVRSEALPASLKDLEYTTEITPVGVKTLKTAVQTVEQFIKSPDMWMLLYGTYGTGKTHILRAINTALFPMSVYVTARDLEDMVHTYRKEDALGDLYNLLRYAPVFILDDFGMEYGGPLMGSMVDRIIDARYARFPEYPVVIATNLGIKEIEENRYIPRTGDRILDRQKVIFLPLQGKSYRSVRKQP